MVKFITLAGKKQVGKDTSAHFIKQLVEVSTPLNVKIVHFADALKKACNILFGIPLEDMETETGKQRLTEIKWPLDQLRLVNPMSSSLVLENSVTPAQTYEVVGHSPHHPQAGEPKFMNVREILQFVGTNLFRNQMDPDIWVKSVFCQPYHEDDLVVIADCRFPNEGDFAREHGLLINVSRETGLASDSHVSEKALDDYQGFHENINNNTSFTDLKEELEQILIKYGFLEN